MKLFLVFCVVIAACVEIGCGSSSSNVSNANTVVITNSNVANTSNIVPYPPANGTTVDANAATLANANQAPVKVISPPANAKPMTFPAPDDSEYSTMMDKSGQAIETRTFHNNPLITKVERVWKGVNEKTVSIYLKSGKVVKVPGDKWPEIKSLPVETFYDAAGVKPPQPVVKGTPAVRKDEKPKQ